MMHNTVKSAVKFRGVGLHTGQSVNLSVAPAGAKSGIVFHRTDLGRAARPIPARYDCVSTAQLCTRLTNDDGLSVSTVEHLLGGMAGCGITDASVSLDGPEVPIMDGSAIDFVRAFARVGIRNLGVPRRAIRVLETISIRIGDKVAALSPAPHFEMDFSVCFSDPAIGKQSLRLVLTGNAIVSELCDSRTFGCLADVERLRREGLGLGGCLKNVVIVDNGRILNQGGLRHADEFVRHKMLDAVGDLALAGAPIVGRYIGVKAGHEISNLLVRELFSRPDAWEWCDVGPDQLPGGRLFSPVPHVSETSIAV